MHTYVFPAGVGHRAPWKGLQNLLQTSVDTCIQVYGNHGTIMHRINGTLINFHYGK